jgi:UDP-glucose 4-epimerase
LKKILITGASGFLARNLIPKLIGKYDVIGVDLRDYDNEEIVFIKSDINNAMAFEYYFDVDLNNIDTVIHLAASTGVRESHAAYNEYVRNNINGTKELLDASVMRWGVKNFIYASSSSVYGDIGPISPTNENHLPSPKSLYSMSKYAGEILVNCYANMEMGNIKYTIIRPCTCYGLYQRKGMLMRNLIESILQDKEFVLNGNGEQRRDYIYSDDICDLFIKAINGKGGVYNGGTEHDYSINEVIGIVSEIMDKEPKIKYQKIKNSWGENEYTLADISRARYFLNWQPKVGIREGLKREIEWLKNGTIK